MIVPTLARLVFDHAVRGDTGAVEHVFRPDRPLRHAAGQHGLWVVPRGGAKPFTFASAPGSPGVSLVTTAESGSRFKRALGALVPGDRIRVAGPLGGFTLDPAAQEVVMLAQGIGITPFLSMLREAASRAEAGPPTTLVHVGVHHCRAETEPAATRSSYPQGRDAFGASLRQVAAGGPGAQFLVSGTPAFVAATTAQLRATGVGAGQLRKDRFYGARRPAGATTREPVAA